MGKLGDIIIYGTLILATLCLILLVIASVLLLFMLI